MEKVFFRESYGIVSTIINLTSGNSIVEIFDMSSHNILKQLINTTSINYNEGDKVILTYSLVTQQINGNKNREFQIEIANPDVKKLVNTIYN